MSKDNKSNLSNLISWFKFPDFKLIDQNKDLINKLNENTMLFRNGITDMGYLIKEGQHPIVPIMLGDAKLSKLIADEMLESGIYVIGFIFGNLLGVYSVLFTNIVTFIGVAFGIYIAMNRIRP